MSLLALRLRAETGDPVISVSESAEGRAALAEASELAKTVAKIGLGFGLVPVIYHTVTNRNAKEWITSYLIGIIIYLVAFNIFI